MVLKRDYDTKRAAVRLSRKASWVINRNAGKCSTAWEAGNIGKEAAET